MDGPDKSRQPYPGLRPFEADEADLFFGREEHVDALLERLANSHFVAVVGESGAGKSSLVRAGLLPALDAGFVIEAGSDWRVAVMRPGGSPLNALADALLAPGVLSNKGGAPQNEFALAELRRGPLGIVQLVQDAHLNPHCNVVIVVDQFEELFRYCREPAQKDQANVFVELLLRASSQTRVSIFVVLTMRSDFIGDCARFRGLPEALNHNQYLTPRLTREQIAKVIREPARVCGGSVEDALVDELCNAVGDDQDQLPLLQHLLMRLWELAGKMPGPPRLTRDLSNNKDIGGMHSALNNHAQQIYESLSDEKRLNARALFKSLTDPHSQRRDLRRDALVSEIAAVANTSSENVVAVANEFRAAGRHMLMPPPAMSLDANSRLDVSHESLIRQWASLNEWAREEVAVAHEFDRLRDEARREQEGKGELLTGRNLAQALDWLKLAQPTPGWAERYAPKGELEQTLVFIRKSEADAKQRKEEELQISDRAAAAERSKRRNRILVAALVASIVVVVGAVDLGIRANHLRHEAEDNATKAEAQTTLATEKTEEAKKDRLEAVKQTEIANEEKDKLHSGKLAANAQLELAREPALAVLLAKASISEPGSGAEAVRALRNAVAEHVPNVESSFIVAKSRNYIPGTNKNNWLDFSISGTNLFAHDHMAIIPSGNDAVIWSMTTGQVMHRLHHDDIVGSASFSPDNRIAVTTSADKTARVWDPSTGKSLGQALAHKEMVNNAVFNRNGTLLVTLGDDRTAHVWTVGEYSKPRCDVKHPGNFVLASFSKDQDRMATLTHGVSNNWQAQVWNVSADSCKDSMEAPSVAVPSLVAKDGRERADLRWAGFSDDGVWLGLVSDEGTVTIISALDWTPKCEFMPTVKYVPEEVRGGAPIPNIAWSRDGKHFAAAGADNVVYVHSLDSCDRNSPSLELRGHTGRITSITFSPVENILLTTSEDRTARLWKIGDGNRIVEKLVLRGHLDTVGSAAFSPSGNEVITVGDDGKLRTWKPIFTLKEQQIPGLREAAYSADGKQIWISGFESSDRSRGRTYWLSTMTAATLMRQSESFKAPGESGMQFYSSARPGMLLSTLDDEIKLRDLREPSRTSTLVETKGVDLPDAQKTSPNGRYVFGFTPDVVKIWDTNAPQSPPKNIPKQFAGNEGKAYEVKGISNDGAQLAWYWLEKDRISITRVGRIQPVAMQLKNKAKVEAVQFSTNGEWLAISFEDYSVQVFESSTGASKTAMRGHTGPILGIAFSVDSGFLVSASADLTLRVWDVESGEEIGKTEIPKVSNIVFSPDGLSVLLVAPSRLLTWRCYACGDPAQILKEVQNRHIRRTLTDAQQGRFGLQAAELTSDGPVAKHDH